MNPSVVFGMTLFNRARHLPQAIESLLSQSDRDFGLVLIDDGSTDDTASIAMAYARGDDRVRFVRHAERQGVVPSWQDAVHQAVAAFPDARLFAWASDHDWWHPEWLARVRRALETAPGAVLAYALTQRVDDALAAVDKPPKLFDTTAMTTPSARVLAFAGEPAGAGDMVYGLVRLDALRRAGIFRPVTQPDRLLMIELALAGTFVQVPEVLWLRRQPAEGSISRQRWSLFAEADRPPALDQPVWLQHSRILWREYVAGQPPPGLTKPGMAWLIVRYQVAYLFRHHSKSGELFHRTDKVWEAVVQQQKEAARWLRWRAYRMQQALAPRHVALVCRKYWLHVWNRGLYRAAVLRRQLRAAAYETRVAASKRFALFRRGARRLLHDVLVLTHRAGLRKHL